MNSTIEKVIHFVLFVLFWAMAITLIEIDGTGFIEFSGDVIGSMVLVALGIYGAIEE